LANLKLDMQGLLLVGVLWHISDNVSAVVDELLGKHLVIRRQPVVCDLKPDAHLLCRGTRVQLDALQGLCCRFELLASVLDFCELQLEFKILNQK
jgi:hypothetical protein